MPGRGMGRELAGQCQTVNAGELEVQEDQGGLLGLDSLQKAEAILCLKHGVTRRLQEISDQFPAQWVIIHDQDRLI